MTCVIHISDPHFGTEQPAVVEALTDLIKTLSPRALLLGGDVTQRARRAQFDGAAAFLSRFDCPVMVVPGNHDIPLYNIFARVFDPYGGYKRVFGPNLEPVWQSDEFLVVGVNTTRPRRHKDGEISRGQIQRVVDMLSRAGADQLRIVLAHHPVRVTDQTDKPNLMHGREDAVPAWIDAGVDIILGGHIHLPYVVNVKSETSRRQAWVVQAGTATSSRTREGLPNSVNVIRRTAGGNRACETQRWDFDAARACFIQVEQHTLAQVPWAAPELEQGLA